MNICLIRFMSEEEKEADDAKKQETEEETEEEETEEETEEEETEEETDEETEEEKEDYFPYPNVYTEDGIPVQRVHFFKVPPEMSKDTLKSYFLRFGNILDLRLGNDPRKKFEPYLSGDVLFANAKDAAKALECRAPSVDWVRFEVQPSYSWLQPDAYGPPAEDQQQDLGPISILTHDCWVHILQFLGMRDKVRFARSCQRFREIYQMATAGQHKSVCALDIYDENMTLWDTRDFYQMSGKHMEVALCKWYGRHHDEIVDFVTEYCRNLISLDFEDVVLTKDTLLKMPTSIERLKLCGQNVFNDLPIICKHFFKLRELSLTVTKVSSPAWSYIVEENCCPSLEVLEISLYGNNKCDILAQLPELKSFAIDVRDRQSEIDIIDQLVIHKAEQLERFELRGEVDLSIREISQISKLTSLRRLNLSSCRGVTDYGLKELVVLKKLEEISVLSLEVSNSAILDLFIGCPKLSQLNARFSSSTTYVLVQNIVAKVRQEMAKNEIHRKLPIRLDIYIDRKIRTELFLKNLETVNKDIIKISFFSL